MTKRQPLKESESPDERGFSLMEAVVASVIAVIAVVGLAHSFAAGKSMVDRYECARDALGLAQRRLELLTALGARPGAPADLLPGMHSAGTTPLTGAVLGTESWLVEHIDDPLDGPDPGGYDYRRVTVTVSWTEGESTDAVELSRIIGEP